MLARAVSIALLFASSAACGGGDEPAPRAGGNDPASSGGGETQAEAGPPPVPCAVLASGEQTSTIIGQPPDNARASDLSLENLPTKAASLAAQLVRVKGNVEAVARDGKWLVLHDPLFDGWVFVEVREEGIRIPAGARGCAATLEGTLEQISRDENETELQKREGRPPESIPEQGPDPVIVLTGVELKQPDARAL